MAKPNAQDHAHHLSDVARARVSSPLKSLIKYMGRPGIVSLAGGFPHAGYFPFESVGARAYAADAFPVAPHDGGFVTRGDGLAPDVTVPRYGEPGSGGVDLAGTLQYTLAMGVAPLRAFIREFTGRVFQPAYADYATYIHAGNTDAWAIIVDTLFNPGQGYFTEEFSYPSAQATAVPHGVKPVPIGIDAQGLSADDLRRVCAEWDPAARGGMPRPHVLYTVPVGQNPCGTTTGADRKKAIYDVCVEYDIIIVEDDPYYFLQQDQYVPPAERPAYSNVEDSDDEFLTKLAPSYLAFDYQGRVIRLDSFSKTVAPGVRLGWYTCAPLFAERFERQAETSTQNPNGLGQALVTTLLTQQWNGVPGYIRWLRGMRAQYTMRRDFIVDTIAELFPLTPRADGVLEAGSPPLFEFVPPVGGMFLWVKLHMEKHPESGKKDVDTLERDLWTEFAEDGLLVAPGWFFNAAELQGKGNVRLAYSYTDAHDMRKALEIFARVVRRVFNAPA